MIIFAPMKKLLYITGIILLFAANTTAANADFFGARVEVAAKGGMKAITQFSGKTIDNAVSLTMKDANKPVASAPVQRSVLC